MDKQERIVIKCPLCGEEELNVLPSELKNAMQCISCGYSTSDEFVGGEESESFKNLDDDMKRWSKEANGHMWIPSVVNLPVGLLFPIDKKDDNTNVDWSFAPMVKISESEKENYPIPDTDGQFYENRIDMEKQIGFDSFKQAIFEINTIMNAREKLQKEESKKVDVNLPKLKKLDG